MYENEYFYERYITTESVRHIVNVNTSDQSGSHWVCYYRNGGDNSRGNSTVPKDW